MDVLTHLFNEMYLSGEVVACFDLTAPWGIAMPPHGGVFHAIDRGNFWVRLAPDGELFQVSSGDLIIFPRGASHEIVDSPCSPAIPLEEALRERDKDSLNCPFGGGGSGTTLVCGVFHFREGDHYAFCSLLPPVLHIRRDKGDTSQWLQTTMKRLSEEAAAASPGALTVISRLTDVLFIEGVRTWLKTQAAETRGLLGALNDPLVSNALSSFHNEPGRNWTIDSLAAEVGLSRSALAAHFTKLVGEPPMRYVTGWRMQLARNWLRGTDMGLAEMAERVGYASEDAFKRAFKREVGVPPGSFRRTALTDSLVA